MYLSLNWLRARCVLRRSSTRLPAGVANKRFIIARRRPPPQRSDQCALWAPGVRNDSAWLRAPSATDLFRREFYLTLKAKGETVNPATAGAHRLVDEAFAALSHEELVKLQERSRLLSGVAARNRARRKDERAAQRREMIGDVAGGSGMTETCDTLCVAACMRSVASGCRCGLGQAHPSIVVSLNAVLQDAHKYESAEDRAQLFRDAAASSVRRQAISPWSSYPVSVDLLKKSLASKGVRPTSGDFRAAASSIGTAGSSTDGTFPETVSYPRCCGAMCLKTEDKQTLCAWAAVMRGFGLFASRWTSSKIASADVLLAVTTAPPSGVEYVMLPFHQARSGLNLAEQMFVSLQIEVPDGDMADDVSGATLRFGFEELRGDFECSPARSSRNCLSKRLRAPLSAEFRASPCDSCGSRTSI